MNPVAIIVVPRVRPVLNDTPIWNVFHGVTPKLALIVNTCPSA